MAAYLPPGWPAGVHPPGTEEFEQTAVTWLLDVVPPDYRLHGVLLRHPLALAALARHHVAACVAGARQGYRTARAELGQDLPSGSITAVLAAYQSEGRRLVETGRAIELITRALRGEVFVPRLAGSSDDRRHTTREAGSQPETRFSGTTRSFGTDPRGQDLQPGDDPQAGNPQPGDSQAGAGEPD